MQGFRSLSFAAVGGVALTLLIAGPSQAAWLLSDLGEGSIGLSRLTNGVADGTSNTIFLGENSRVAACFDNASTPGGITDGTSNTILFGENAALNIVPGSILARAPVQQIADGTSNTIFVGELAGSFCLGDTEIGEAFVPGIADGTSNTIVVGEQTELDVCFRNPQRIVDGTSNTIFVGETLACYDDVRPARDLVAEVPVPASLGLLVAALGTVGVARRRRAM